MSEIIIKQPAKKTQVWLDSELKFEGGRVAAKKFAVSLKEKTGLPLYNIKKSGNKVLCG